MDPGDIVQITLFQLVCWLFRIDRANPSGWCDVEAGGEPESWRLRPHEAWKSAFNAFIPSKNELRTFFVRFIWWKFRSCVLAEELLGCVCVCVQPVSDYQSVSLWRQGPAQLLALGQRQRLLQLFQVVLGLCDHHADSILNHDSRWENKLTNIHCASLGPNYSWCPQLQTAG